MFGTTNTFGQPASSPFAPPQSGFGTKFAFGSPTPTPFGCSACGGTGAFGFGHNPTFGCEFAPTQSSPLGSTTHHNNHCLHFVPVPLYLVPPNSFVQLSLLLVPTPLPLVPQAAAFGATSIPGFGVTRSPFESTGTAFGVSNALASGSGGTFGASSTPVVAISTNPAFGASSTPFSFCFSPAFVQPTVAFGATSFGTHSFPFGKHTGTAFGVSNAPAFGSGGTFGSSSTPAFGSGGTFGASSTPAFGTYSTPAFGASSTPSFSFGSSPAFGQSTAAFGSSPFGTTTVGVQQSSPFGSQSSSPAFGSTTFGQSAFGGQRGGSRVAPYTPTTEADSGSGTQPAAKLGSISAMFVYKDKSHEELRLEDYQLGDKCGPQPAQPSVGTSFGVSAAPASPFGSPATFNQTSATSANPFSAKNPSFENIKFATSTTPLNPFQSASSSLSGPTSTTKTLFSFPPSLFGTGAAPATAPSFATGLDFSSSQSSSLFNSTSAFGQATSTFEQNIDNFGSRSIFNTPSTVFAGNMLSSALSSAPSSNPAAFSSTTPAQATGALGFSNLGQTQSGGESNIFGESK